MSLSRREFVRIIVGRFIASLGTRWYPRPPPRRSSQATCTCLFALLLRVSLSFPQPHILIRACRTSGMRVSLQRIPPLRCTHYLFCLENRSSSAFHTSFRRSHSVYPLLMMLRPSLPATDRTSPSWHFSPNYTPYSSRIHATGRGSSQNDACSILPSAHISDNQSVARRDSNRSRLGTARGRY